MNIIIQMLFKCFVGINTDFSMTCEEIYDIIEDIDKKMKTVGTVYLKEAVGMWHGMYPSSNLGDEIMEIDITFNPNKTIIL